MPVRPSPKKRASITLAAPIPTPEMTARKRSQLPSFRELCRCEGVEPTRRQAAKFNARAGRWTGPVAVN